MHEPTLRLLGQTELARGDRTATPQSGRVCTLLALLALSPGRVVSADRLVDQLWAGEVPQSGTATLHVYVSRLRKQLTSFGVDLTTRTPGYRLDLPRAAVDVHRLVDEVAAAEERMSAGAWEDVLARAASAASLWGGAPFSDAAACPDLETEAVRLEALRDRADELHARALLALGRPAPAEAITVELTRRDPLNETYWRLRIQAAQADGRAADALSAYADYQARLADELGLDPSPAMAELHLEILRSGQSPPPPADPPNLPVNAASTTPAAGPEPPATRRPVIGRAAELAVVDRAVAAAAAGSGRVVSLEGEPGIGKTLLAEHAAARARSAGLAVVWTRAVDGPGTPALWIWEQVLADLADLAVEGAASGAEQLHALAAVGESDLDPVEARFRLSEQLAGRVVAASRQRPLLMVVDDLQWVDDGTLHALRLLGPSVRKHSFSLVLTSRRTPADSELAATLAQLGRSEATTRIDLRPFSADDVATYLRDRDGDGLDPAVLHERTGGNPLFVSELVRSGSLADDQVPATVSGLVRQRISALPAATVAVLEVAAVAGRRLDPEVLAHALDLPVLQVLSRLGPALDDGVVVAGRTLRSRAFSHDLVRDAIAEGVDPVRRAEVHDRLAQAIAQIYADELDDHVDELAVHRFEAAAGTTSRPAYEICMRAADIAAGRSAYDQAATQRSRALAALPPGEASRIERFEVLMQLTGERRLAGDVVGASASLRSAIQLAQRLGDRGRLVRAVVVLGGVTLWNWRQFGEVDTETVALLRGLLGSVPDAESPALSVRERAELAGTLAVELYYGDDQEEGSRLAREAVRLAREVGDPVLLGRALNNQVIATWRPGRDAERRAALDEALGWAGQGLPAATEVVARLHRGPLALRAADVVGFEADLDRAADLTPRLGMFELEGQVTSQHVGRALLRGEHELAEELIEQTYGELRRTSLWAPEYTRLVHDTTLARMRGRVGDVADRLVARAYEEVHRSLRWTTVLVLAQAGDVRQARALQVRWGLQHLEPRTHWGSTFEWAQAAETALLLGRPEPAEVYPVVESIDAELVVVGTALATLGPVAHLLAGLADAVGDPAAGRRHRDEAGRVTERVTAQLGRSPAWCYPSDHARS